jgi:hypothetical protein
MLTSATLLCLKRPGNSGNQQEIGAQLALFVLVEQTFVTLRTSEICSAWVH